LRSVVQLIVEAGICREVFIISRSREVACAHNRQALSTDGELKVYYRSAKQRMAETNQSWTEESQVPENGAFRRAPTEETTKHTRGASCKRSGQIKGQN
jgi:hypothetical protein